MENAIGIMATKLDRLDKRMETMAGHMEITATRENVKGIFQEEIGTWQGPEGRLLIATDFPLRSP